ncbi:ATP-binding protein [Micromonospora sp. WMMA1923]|uniref:ATP-binding protein n=1 Tax=Micromonospora sp. WMMA1923 TaxID=3404125 RepID=UPI003B93A394
MSWAENAAAHSGSAVPTDRRTPPEVRCRVEAGPGTGTVRLDGVLTRADGEAVRDALLAAVWEHAGPVLVDLTGLRGAEPSADRVFAEAHRAVAGWPTAGLVLLDPAEVTGRGGSAPLDPYAPRLCATLAEARAALAGARSTPAVDVDLAPVVGAARQARALIGASCQRWELPELVEPGCIAVTELVNNVVAHAGTTMTVRLAPQVGALRLAVRDRSRRLPSYAGLAPPTSTGGRGLLLIDTVARRWGSTAVPDGKVVWCVLHAEDELSFPR